MKTPGAGHEAPGALEEGFFPLRLAQHAGREVHAEKIRLGIAAAQQFQAVSHAAAGVEHAMRPAADVIEPLEHAPLDFPLEHPGVAARRCGTLEAAPHLCGVQAECLCAHPDSVTISSQL